MSAPARSEATVVVEATAPCRVDLAGGVLAGFPEALRPAAAVSVAVALDRRAYCRVSRIASGVRVESKDTLLKLHVPSAADLPTEGVAGLARSVLLAIGIESGLELITQARVPFEAGLGSATALAVTMAAAAARAFGRALPPDALASLARALPTDLEGGPRANVDILAALRGGVVTASITGGDLTAGPEGRVRTDPGRVEECLLLVDPASGPPRAETSAPSSPVDEAAVRSALADVSRVAERFRDALAAERTDSAELADLVAAEHDAWGRLGLLTPGGAPAAIARLARASGGAARACGRGPKSLVLVWAAPGARGEGPRESLMGALKASGYRSFPCRVDLRGLEVEEA